MSKFIGRKVEIGIGLESSRGVGVTPTVALGKVDFSMYDKTVDARLSESLGHIADSEDKFVQEKYAQGSLGGILGANSALYLMALAFGDITTPGAAVDSVYPWDVPVDNDNIHPSASLLVKDVNQSLLHKLVMLEQLEIEIPNDDLVKYTAEFVAKRAVTSLASMPSYAEDYKFGKRLAKVSVADAIAGLTAASRLPLKNLKLTIKKNLLRDSQIGTVEPTDINNQQLSIEGELTLNYNDQTYKNYMLDGTKKAMRIHLSSEKLIGSTGRGELIIDLSKVDFFSWEPDAKIDDIISQKINFKCNYDVATGKIVDSVTVNNALATK